MSYESELQAQFGPLHREIKTMREALNRIQAVLAPADNSENVETVGRAREIALVALNRS